MKQALVLGLALAANAMVPDQGDNELIIAPTDQFGNIKQYPGHIRFDEQADHELSRGFGMGHEDWIRKYDAEEADHELLAMKPREESKHDMYLKLNKKKPFEESKMTEEYRKFLEGRRKIAAAADDEELFVAPQGKLADLAKKYPGMIMFDEEADNELSRGFITSHEEWIRKYDAEEADDELLVRPLVPHIAYDDDEFAALLLPRGAFKSNEEYEKYYAYVRSTFDDAADDELAVKYVHLPVAETVAYDDDENYVYHKSKKPIIEQADDELLALNQYGPLSGVSPYQMPAFVNFDEVADDELALKIVHLPTAEHLAYAFDEVADDELRIRPISVLPESIAADDELSFMPIPPKVFVNRDWLPVSEALRRDDEADDELAYLGHLLNERAQPTSFGEYKKRAEKPSHIKAEERAQMQRKFRPHPDIIPMAQN